MNNLANEDGRPKNDIGARAGEHGLRTALIIIVVVVIAGLLVWQFPADHSHVANNDPIETIR